MKMKKLRAAFEARPFQPFIIRLTDGVEIPMPTPEFLMVPPRAVHTFVAAPAPDVYKIVDISSVATLDFDRRISRRRTR